MRFFTILCSLLLMIISTSAQPSWVKDASKSVFTLKTFSADGALLASSNGFFIGESGEAISNFTPFKGASRAVIIDANGKEHQVSGLIGVNDIYDVVKFRINIRKAQSLTISPSSAKVGQTVWLLPYREVKNVKDGMIRKAETFMDNYDYYTVALNMSNTQVGCPLINEEGQVIGLMQQPASDRDTLSYAVSARFADSLRFTAFTYNDEMVKQTKMKREFPNDIKEATLVLYLSSTQMDSMEYVSLIDEFIQQFPSAPDGYIYRAQQKASIGEFADADTDMLSAQKLSETKDDVHYNYARIIYNKEIYQSALPYPNWNLDKALKEIQAANSINLQPTYRQLEANILFAQQKYDDAYTIFTELTNTNLRSAEVFYSAARCKEMLKDTTAFLSLLDSTLNTFSKPYFKEAAPYLWARVEARRDAGKFRDAISDMNEYESLMAATINDNFYYIRHQIEIQARLYQQALNDINRAIQMNSTEILYYAEKASLEIRVGLYDNAILTAQECIKLDANNSDGYLFLGLAQCLKGQKTEGFKNLEKAKALGDSQADALMEKYK